MTLHTDLSGLSSAQQREMLTKLLQQKVASAQRYPMSIGQQGLWHAFRRDPQSTAFNVFLPTRMRAAVDMAALQKSIQWVTARHVCLHTVFSDADGQLVQIVKPDLQADFEFIELPGGSDDEAREILAREMSRPFDLEQGPLLRVLAVRLADDDWIILALTHHIVVDFWSLILILNELRQVYPRFARRELPELAAAQNNYSRFVQDQQSLMASPLGAEQQNFWQSIVQQSMPVLDLTIDNLRPSVFQNAATSTLLEFPDSLVPRINALAARSRGTPFSLVHAALQVFLARLSGQTKFLIGSPFSGRRQQQYEQTVGFFINMLPLAADLEGDPTFTQLIARTCRHVLDALEHETYPIAQIVHDASLPRDPARSPLFQVSCTFEKSQVKLEAGRAAFLFPNQQQVWDFAGLPQESFYVPHPTCHYDLEFVFEQTDTKLRGMILACRALFESETVTAMAENFSSLLQALVAQSDLPISQIPWPTSLATDGLLRTGTTDRRWSDTRTIADARPAEFANTVSGMITAAAARYPRDVALQFGGKTITYAEFVDSAARLAIEIRSKCEHRQNVPQASQDDPLKPIHLRPIVPIYTESGPLACVGMLAVQLSGAIPVAIDLTQPAVNAASLMNDTAAQVWLGHPTHRYVSELDPTTGIDLEFLFEHTAPRLTADPADSLGNGLNHAVVVATSVDVAYLVYTSGSTGKPKGVLVEHGAVCNTLQWRAEAVPLFPTDRVLMLLSHQFDAALGIAWSALTQGATLVWADERSTLDPQLLIEQMVRDEVTVLPAIPSLLRVLVAHPRFAECQSLRLIFTGGEAMPSELPSQVRQVSKARFWNFYGPSEAAIEATACEVTHHSPMCCVPIGQPISNTQVWVLDDHQRPVPDTVPGELAIAGVGLARGYLNDPELTQRKFIRLQRETLGGEVELATGTRVYLTGDRGRRMPDGRIEFLGRTDHQIKLRGYRIELGEIEAILQSHPQVERAAVKLLSPGTTQSQLIGYITVRQAFLPDTPLPSPPTSLLATSLRRHARNRLPAYKVPMAIIIVDSLPLTASGKVDRSRLPDFIPSEEAQLPFEAPETALEKFIADAWCKSLQVTSMSTNVNYFDAGGSSLGAAMLTSHLSQALGIHVPTALLFDLADISQVATRLAQLHGNELTHRFGAQAIAQQRSRARQPQTATTDSTKPSGNHFTAMHPLLSPLKATGTRPPIFMVHPPGGIVICYRELARLLNPDQPLLAIRARGLHGHEALPESLELMAADYLQAVREVQPSGPYTIGGWSLGGLVAYEMAQQLLCAGQELSHLLLLDTSIPQGSTDLVPASELVNVGLEYGIELTLDQLGQLSPAEQLPFLWKHAEGLGVIDDQSPPEVVARVLEDLQGLFHHHVTLASQYRLEPLAARIELFRPTETPYAVNVSHDRGWRHVANSVQVHYVPGHHHSMVQAPHVEQLARLINEVE